jgi:hypothetical protein
VASPCHHFSFASFPLHQVFLLHITSLVFSLFSQQSVRNQNHHEMVQLSGANLIRNYRL